MKKAFLITILSITVALATAATVTYITAPRAFVPLITVTAIFCALFLAVMAILSLTFSAKKKKAVKSVEKSLSVAFEGKYYPSALGGEAETGLKKLATELRAAKVENRRMNYVLDGISQSIIAVDASGVVKLMNAAARELLGCDKSVLGRDLYLAVGAGTLYDSFSKSLKDEGHPFDYERNGKYYAADVIRTDKSEYGEITYVVIITDVSAQRLASRQRSDFFSNASHELKTPLTSIQGNTELLLSVVDEHSQQEKYARRIQREVKRLHTLILDMLKLSSIENLKLDARLDAYVPVSLREAALEAMASLAPECEQKQLSVSVNGNGFVTADPKNIYELVGNLCSNAVHYNVNGGSVDVTVEEAEENVKLTVSDSGIGIEAKHVPRLCERFYRVDKSRSKLTGGTGLGLAIVKHVCALYSAKLDISSEAGKGTTVTVLFPRSQA